MAFSPQTFDSVPLEAGRKGLQPSQVVVWKEEVPWPEAQALGLHWQ